MLKVGIIGCGFMGTTHAHAYYKLPGVQVAILVDSDRERAIKLAKEMSGIDAVDAEVIFSDPTINLVDVTVPTPFHSEYAVRAMNAGKHVVVEKPLALSLAEADAILEVSHRTGKFLMVAQLLRFWPEYAAIHDLLQSGQLGRPLSASAYRLSNPPQWASWFLNPAMTGGTVLDLAIHDIDMMNWLFGKPNQVFASGAGEENGDWSTVMVQGWHDEVRTSIEASFHMPRDFPFAAGIRVLCEEGAVEYRFQAGGASLEQGQPINSLLLHEPGKPNQHLAAPVGDAFECEIAYFIECIRKGEPPAIIPPEDARLAVATALSARESIISGQPVRMG